MNKKYDLCYLFSNLEYSCKRFSRTKIGDRIMVKIILSEVWILQGVCISFRNNDLKYARLLLCVAQELEYGTYSLFVFFLFAFCNAYIIANTSFKNMNLDKIFDNNFLKRIRR
ncbi:hypothetical protein PGB90_004683 [Kerria lacca]